MSVSTVNAAGSGSVESSKSALSWGAILAGAVTATGATLILLLLGSGIGLTMVSPWSGQSSSATTVGVTAAMWLVLVQWLSSALGGYLTGRLRTKWTAVRTPEVFFRDTAHGLIVWAVATVFVVGFLSSAIASLMGAGGTVVGAAATAAGATGTAAVAASNQGSTLSTSYFTDMLLRPERGVARSGANEGAAPAEVARVLLQGAATGDVPENDKAYLASVVSTRTGLPDAVARARVDSVLKQVDGARMAATEAADQARKAAATSALIGSLSLLMGAFIAAAAAAMGGRQRDEEEDALVR
ncbi:MAG: hypothetical protein ACOVKO_07740 [Elstera sp.]